MMNTKALLALVTTLTVSAWSQVSSQRVFTDPNSAMEPTILLGEKFTMSNAEGELKRGDIVVLETRDPHDPKKTLLVVKRIIAVGGDTISGKQQKVFLNGKLFLESYVQHQGPPESTYPSLDTFGPVTVSEGKFFVAGDNRDYSLDSRIPEFGLVSSSQVRGKASKIVSSPRPERIEVCQLFCVNDQV